VSGDHVEASALWTSRGETYRARTNFDFKSVIPPLELSCCDLQGSTRQPFIKQQSSPGQRESMTTDFKDNGLCSQ
jgi:hypothetical protein